MAYAVEDERHFMMECSAYQEIRANFQELFDDCEGDMRKLMCHPKQHSLAKLVHKMRVFRDEDTAEWLFDLQPRLDRVETNDEESSGDVFSSDNEEFELIEVDLRFFGSPLSLVLAPGFFFSFKCNIQTVIGVNVLLAPCPRPFERAIQIKFPMT